MSKSRVYAKVMKEWQASTPVPDGARVYDLVHQSWKRDAARATARALDATNRTGCVRGAGRYLHVATRTISPVAVGTVAKVVSPATGDSALRFGR